MAEGVKAKYSVENSKKIKKNVNCSKQKPKPKVLSGFGSSKCLRGVGLIHFLQNPRSDG